MLQHKDTLIIAQVLDSFTLFQRREWYVKILMATKGKSFKEMGKKFKIIPWYLAAMVCGDYHINPRSVRLLERELGVDLGPFLNEKEVERLKRSI